MFKNNNMFYKDIKFIIPNEELKPDKQTKEIYGVRHL